MPKDGFDPMQAWRKQEKAREQRRKKALRDARLMSQVGHSARKGEATQRTSKPEQQRSALQRSSAVGNKLAFKVESVSRQRPKASNTGTGDGDAFWARDPASLLEELRSMERLAAANDGMLPLVEQRVRRKHLSDQLARINKARRLTGLVQLELEMARSAEGTPSTSVEDGSSCTGQDKRDEKDPLLDEFYAEISHLL